MKIWKGLPGTSLGGFHFPTQSPPDLQGTDGQEQGDQRNTPERRLKSEDGRGKASRVPEKVHPCCWRTVKGSSVEQPGTGLDLCLFFIFLRPASYATC